MIFTHLHPSSAGPIYEYGKPRDERARRDRTVKVTGHGMKALSPLIEGQKGQKGQKSETTYRTDMK